MGSCPDAQPFAVGICRVMIPCFLADGITGLVPTACARGAPTRRSITITPPTTAVTRAIRSMICPDLFLPAVYPGRCCRQTIGKRAFPAAMRLPECRPRLNDAQPETEALNDRVVVEIIGGIVQIGAIAVTDPDKRAGTTL